jgi:hypothetical protein
MNLPARVRCGGWNRRAAGPFEDKDVVGQKIMPVTTPDPKALILPRLGAAVVGAAIVVPALRLPLIFGCLAALANRAWSRGRVEDVVPETPPARPRRGRARRNGQESVADTTEDSFPASDPPSRTPVTGTRTRH